MYLWCMLFFYILINFILTIRNKMEDKKTIVINFKYACYD